MKVRFNKQAELRAAVEYGHTEDGLDADESQRRRNLIWYSVSKTYIVLSTAHIYMHLQPSDYQSFVRDHHETVLRYRTLGTEDDTHCLRGLEHVWSPRLALPQAHVRLQALHHGRRRLKMNHAWATQRALRLAALDRAEVERIMNARKQQRNSFSKTVHKKRLQHDTMNRQLVQNFLRKSVLHNSPVAKRRQLLSTIPLSSASLSPLSTLSTLSSLSPPLSPPLSALPPTASTTQ